MISKKVISVVPQLQFFKVDPNWEFVVVGSDGVWDAMSSQEMSNYVKVRGYIHSFIHICLHYKLSWYTTISKYS